MNRRHPIWMVPPRGTAMGDQWPYSPEARGYRQGTHTLAPSALGAVLQRSTGRVRPGSADLPGIAWTPLMARGLLGVAHIVRRL